MKDYIFHQIRANYGSDETTELTLVTNMKSGKTQIKLSKTVIQRFETEEQEKAEEIFEKITGGNGRRVYKPEDLL